MIRAQSFLIDGEAVVCRDDGLSDFNALRTSKVWLKSKNPASEAVRREREEDWDS